MTHLPKPDTHCFDDDTQKDVWSHSDEQMFAYGKAERERALEEAALLCDGIAQRNWARTLAAQCAEVIRALKEKP